MINNSYIRETDGALMVEVKPHQFVNEHPARMLGFPVRDAPQPAAPRPAPLTLVRS